MFLLHESQLFMEKSRGSILFIDGLTELKKGDEEGEIVPVHFQKCKQQKD